MTKIDGGQTNHVPTQDTSSAAGTDSTTSIESESTGALDFLRPEGMVDADEWDQAMDSFDDFVGGSSPASSEEADAPAATTRGGSAEEPRAVWEMMHSGGTTLDSYLDASRLSSAAPTDTAPAEASFNIAENAPANAIAASLRDDVFEDAGPRAISREVSIILDRLPASGGNALIDLVANSDDLRANLLEIYDNPRVVDGIVSEVQDRVIADVGAQITETVRPQLEAGMDALSSLNDSSDSRRAFLAAVATDSDSKAEIESVLTKFGLSSGATDKLADVLNELRTDDDAISAFLDGDRGDRGITNPRGEFASAERIFENQLNNMHGGLDSLHSAMGTNEIRHDQFLTDPRVAPVRDEILADMGAVMGPPGQENELGVMFNEAIGDSNRAQTADRIGRTAIATGTTAVLIGLTAGTATPFLAGVATTVATTGVQAAPDLAIAAQDVHRSQAAVNVDLADSESIQISESDRNVAFALAAAQAFTGVAATKVAGQSLGSQVLTGTIGAGTIEAGAATRDTLN